MCGTRHTARGGCRTARAADLAFVAQGGHHRELVVEVDDLIAVRAQPGAGVEAAEVDHR
ncbi:hypothetical protein JHN63_13645 [Streptomyces sp. MBT65]|nr:hypothetical protein [Streptomyces sp. MBT65]